MNQDSIAYVNELRRDGDGWALLAPFGDFRSTAIVVKPGGSVTRVASIQRLDRQAAEAMAENFNSVTGKIKRWLRGVPIYSGHPDVPQFGAAYPDKSEKGVIQALQVRDDGLYAQPVFNDGGAQLLNGDAKLFFSGRWSSESAGEEEGLPVFRPSVLRSVGLTSQPHLPTELLNDAATNADQTEPEVKLAALIALLQGASVTIANDATEAQAEAGVQELIRRAQQAEQKATEHANAVTARDNTVTQLKTELANAQSAHRADLLAVAVQDGRITPAEVDAWKGRLETAFANERTALIALPPKIKLQGQGDGQRKDSAAQFANTAARLVAFNQEIHRLTGTGLSYDEAFAIIRRDKPELVGQSAA